MSEFVLVVGAFLLGAALVGGWWWWINHRAKARAAIQTIQNVGQSLK